jgi:hypothetical protein
MGKKVEAEKSKSVKSKVKSKLVAQSSQLLDGDDARSALGLSPITRSASRNAIWQAAEAAMRAEEAAKATLAATVARQQKLLAANHTRMVAAFNKVKDLQRNGKPLSNDSEFGTRGKLSLTKVAKKFSVSAQNLRYAVNSGGVAKPGRPPKTSEIDIQVLHHAVTKQSIAGDAMAVPAADILRDVAAKKGNAYQTKHCAQLAPTTERRLKQRIREGGVMKTRGIPTDLKRLALSRGVLEQHASEVLRVVRRYQALRDRRRWVNIDETPNCERGEKKNRQTWCLTSRIAMKKTRGKAVRTRAMEDGNGPLSFVPALRGDGKVITAAFLTCGHCEPPPLRHNGELLPGLGNPFGDPIGCRIYPTAKGSMTREVLEQYLKEQLVPAMRREPGLATGPLAVVMDAPKSHGRSTTLRAFLKKENVVLLLLPHMSSTVTQMLDVDWFLHWRDEYQAAADALLEVSKSKHKTLGPNMRVQHA